MKEFIAGLVCTVLWASMMVIVPMVQVDPIALMYTTVLTSVVTLGMILLFNIDKHILTMHALTLKEIRLIALGGALIIAYNTCIYVALKRAEPTEVVIINYLWSIILMVFLSVVWGKKILLKNIALGFMAFLGASISLLEGKGFGALELGHFLALLAAFLGAGYLAVIIKLKEGIPSTSFIYFSMEPLAKLSECTELTPIKA